MKFSNLSFKPSLDMNKIRRKKKEEHLPIWRSSFYLEVERSEPRTIVWMGTRRFERSYFWLAFWYERARCCSNCRRHRWFLSFWRCLRSPTKSCRDRDEALGIFCYHLVYVSCVCVVCLVWCWPLVYRVRTFSSFSIVDVYHQWHVVYAIDLLKYLKSFSF